MQTETLRSCLNGERRNDEMRKSSQFDETDSCQHPAERDNITLTERGQTENDMDVQLRGFTEGDEE